MKIGSFLAELFFQTVYYEWDESCAHGQLKYQILNISVQ